MIFCLIKDSFFKSWTQYSRSQILTQFLQFNLIIFRKLQTTIIIRASAVNSVPVSNSNSYYPRIVLELINQQRDQSLSSTLSSVAVLPRVPPRSQKLSRLSERHPNIVACQNFNLIWQQSTRQHHAGTINFDALNLIDFVKPVISGIHIFSSISSAEMEENLRKSWRFPLHVLLR